MSREDACGARCTVRVSGGVAWDEDGGKGVAGGGG